MKRTGTILFGLLFAFLAFNGAFAASTMDVSAASPEASGGSIPGGAGNTFTVDLYFDYNGDDGDFSQGGTFGFYFYSNDGSIVNVTHKDVGGVGPFSSITLADSWTTTWGIGSNLTFINQGGQYDIGYDGALADSVYVSGLSLSGGLPSNLGNLKMFSFNLEVLQSTTGDQGTLCIDSAGPHPDFGGDLAWLLTDPATFNGPYCWTITGLTQTDVTELDSGDLLPTEFGLSQNYPNPFNPTTTFEFALPSRAKVDISVFNVLGQKVATLADKEYTAGVYEVTWDGTNDQGQQIASGIYFYTMKAGDFSQTRKLMMLK